MDETWVVLHFYDGDRPRRVAGFGVVLSGLAELPSNNLSRVVEIDEAKARSIIAFWHF
jgi:hypothetical protein